MNVKPIIGINSGVVQDDDDKTHRYSLGGSYTNAILKAGGVPVILPASDEPGVIECYLDRIDGILLVGGPDFDPSVYGAKEKLPTVVSLSPLRQDFDLALAHCAIKRDMPIMGVCFGCQVLNVACNGTLIQDIEFQLKGNHPRHYLKIPPYYMPHTVRILTDSLLYQIVKKETFETNSAHHQCILKPGDGIRPTAFSEDNIIECIERPGMRFFLGVQWHPEVIQHMPGHSALFCALVSASGSGGAS